MAPLPDDMKWPDDQVWIESTRASGGQPDACRLHWGKAEWLATVADVRATATDMITCAAYAEVMMAMQAKLELHPKVISRFMSTVLADAHPDRADQSALGLESTLLLMPAGSSKSGEAVVLLERVEPVGQAGVYHAIRQRGMVGAAEARNMAAQWFLVAEGSEQDRLLVEAIPDAWNPDAADALGAEYLADLLDMDLLFAKLRLLRDRKSARGEYP